MGAMFFAVLAVGALLDRNYIREKTPEGRQTAARGNRGGRPKAIDDMLIAVEGPWSRAAAAMSWAAGSAGCGRRGRQRGRRLPGRAAGRGWRR
ncbi:hypothetical protein [Streptomyces shenzhenensis]|uniref:hypothetical protein n=1 Tax=Streptomyces shenzhenensis TaxID=943815 RepID=UPI001C68EDF5|nr:hypothetical protein [Streptomyces shenzhenensis]